MFKLLLCDDDQIVLEGLRTWLCNTYEEIDLIGCAINGNEAKELIDHNEVDILITDICMPFFTGLQLIEYARAANPLLQVIIISGYNDFRYARKAVQLGAIDFVLKPINTDELARLLDIVIANCRLVESNSEVARRNVLRQLLDRADMPDIAITCAQAHLNAADCYSVAILENERYITNDLNTLDEYRYVIYKDFYQLAEQFKSLGIVIISQSYSNMICCLFAEKAADVVTICNKVEQCVLQHNRLDSERHSITMAKGCVYSGLEGLRTSYTEAVTVMRYKYILGKDILDYPSIADKRIITASEDAMPMDRIDIGCLSTRTEIDGIITSLEKRLQQQKRNNSYYCGMVISNLCISLSRDLNDSGIKLTDVFDEPFLELQKVLFSSGFSEILESFRVFLYRIQAYFEPTKRHKHAKAAEAAIVYVQEHYMQPALSLEATAQAVFMSPNYFSSIFREQTGQTFSNYLVAYRIERAKQLILNTNYMFYEISAMVGYPNAPYFSFLFKKKTGFSPSAYKMQHADESLSDDGFDPPIA